MEEERSDHKAVLSSPTLISKLKNAVVNAYEVVLRRSPENEKVVENAATSSFLITFPDADKLFVPFFRTSTEHVFGKRFENDLEEYESHDPVLLDLTPETISNLFTTFPSRVFACFGIKKHNSHMLPLVERFPSLIERRSRHAISEFCHHWDDASNALMFATSDEFIARHGVHTLYNFPKFRTDSGKRTVFFIDHGLGFIKDFFVFTICNQANFCSNKGLRAVFLSSNRFLADLSRSIMHQFNVFKIEHPPILIHAGYSKSESMTLPSTNPFPSNGALNVLYAPTWMTDGPIHDYFNSVLTSLRPLVLSKKINVVISHHSDGKRSHEIFPMKTLSSSIETSSVLQYADIVISDISSVLFESVCIGIPVIQVVQPKYSGIDMLKRDCYFPKDKPFLPIIPWCFIPCVLGVLCNTTSVGSTVEHLLLDPSILELQRPKWKRVADYLDIRNRIPDVLANVRSFAELEENRTVYSKKHLIDVVRERISVLAPHVRLKSRFDKVVVTFGTFDLFHDGHKRLLERARSFGNFLAVGVSTDDMNEKKGKRAAWDFKKRMEAVREFRCVNLVFPEEHMDLKRHYLLSLETDILVMGSDWSGRFDNLKDIVKVVYLARTPGISSTELRAAMSVPLHPSTDPPASLPEVPTTTPSSRSAEASERTRSLSAVAPDPPLVATIVATETRP